jgi:DNA-binding transcriptional MerR regulator
MRDLISIGRFAQVTQLTIKALHIYDAVGLLRPVVVDTATGYRYYSITQLPLARKIRMLRSVDMPLEAISAVLYAPTSAAMDARLHEHQQRIAARIAKDQQALRLLQRLIDHREEDIAFAVQVKQLPARLVASIRFQATPADEGRMIPELLDELERHAEQHDVRCRDQPPVRISHEFSDELVDTEIAVAIARPIPASGRIASRVLEAAHAAYVVNVGPHADLWAIYWAILVWVQENGYEQYGPPREVYWDHPAHGHALTYRTEVQWPIHLSSPPAPSSSGGAHASP